jgi:hypothetical protein
LGVGAIFVFRRRGRASVFRTPLYPITPLLFIAATLYLLANAVIDSASRAPTLAVFAVIATGIPVYFLTVARRRAVRA